MSFSNKVVVVTGGSSGIGAATAIAFAKENAHVVLVDRNEETLSNMEKTISELGETPLAIKADVSKAEDLKRIVQITIEKYGKIDVLVNCAGIFHKAGLLDERLPESYEAMVDVNLKSVVLLTHYAAPHLAKTKGNIVNISSMSGSSTSGGMGTGIATYSVSKAGVDHFTRMSALELSEKGVRVNAISPGPVETPILGSELNWDAIVATTALKILARPEEVADVVLFLASDKCRCVTGHNFVIDSGMKLKM